MCFFQAKSDSLLKNLSQQPYEIKQKDNIYPSKQKKCLTSDKKMGILCPLSCHKRQGGGKNLWKGGRVVNGSRL